MSVFVNGVTGPVRAVMTKEPTSLSTRGGNRTSLAVPRTALLMRYAAAGATIGLLVGLWEAALLYFTPSVREFVTVDATYVIWFLAPLLDVAAFAILGTFLGCIAAISDDFSGERQIVLAAVLIGAVGAHVGWARHLVHRHVGDMHVYDGSKAVLFPFIRFAATFALTLLLARVLPQRTLRLFHPERRWPSSALLKALALIVVLLAAGLFSYTRRNATSESYAEPGFAAGRNSPNIVLITMDTARADHLSCYGYRRLTTPNLDAVAKRGVLFENAIAPTSWTLPSLASIVSGLLPHQDGANSFRSVDPGWKTLAEVMGSRGYATAGFNSNYFYGQAGWGLGQGFGSYDDDRTTWKYNLSRTLIGRAILQPLFHNTKRYDVLFRRNAARLNADATHWLARRPARPYFVYLNYFDAHGPYLAPAPYDHRFGELSGALVRRSFAEGFRPSKPLAVSEQSALIDGYDNCLAYLDDQIGTLVRFIEASPDWDRTIIIIAADHGEAFGEHGAYSHGCDLHREEIRVPLLVIGAGIPAGRRVKGVVELRRLFDTVLDLALGNSVPFSQSSLARLWDPGVAAGGSQEMAVSELSPSLVQAGLGEISLASAEWHYLRTGSGQQELYRWSTDPQERINLVSSPEYANIRRALETRLNETVERSFQPWLGLEYLVGLGPAEYGLLRRERRNPGRRLRNTIEANRIGSAQAYFAPSISVAPVSAVPESERDLLRSLPYQ